MNGHGIDGDFTACDARVLNRFIADYLTGLPAGTEVTPAGGYARLCGWGRGTGGHDRVRAVSNAAAAG